MFLQTSRHAAPIAAVLVVFLPACGGSDGNGSGGNTTGISPDGELAATESIIVSFDDAMDPASLSLQGSLASFAQPAWSNGNATVTLAPADYWPAGAQSIRIGASRASGGNIDPLQAQFEVQSAFTTFQAASVVIGQQDFTGDEVRQGSLGAGASTLDTPMGQVAYAAEQDVFFIPDNGSARVLGFHGIPDANNTPADFVIGQPDLTSSSGGTDASTYRNPQWVTTEHGQLLVTDSESRRILVYNTIPGNGPVAADVVVGQADMTARVIACDQFTAYTTHGHFVTPAGRLFISDADNNRVLMWNTVPTQNGTPADLVLGQPDFDNCAAHDEQGGSDDMRIFNHPVAIWSDDERLVITDNENHRILIWNTFPTENFAEPDVILGQESFENTAPNDINQDGVEDDAVSARVMNLPWTVAFHNNQLFVSDYENNRVLIWNGWPESHFEPADIVIGQQDFESRAPDAGNATAGANTLDGPRGAMVIGNRLFITDTRNSRVLIYDAQ